MRSIPVAMRTKLMNRIQAASTESEPSIRVVATQTSTNILLTEPIHEDITAALGDVALRQTADDDEIALAYAICLDEGTANIYRRTFPATMDYEWEKVWEFGTATDVAIEFDGSWVMDGSKKWYYLQTEQFPYIFTIESGNLYVQKWRDTATRTLLAEGVSQISACKGWASSVDLDNDQGLIIGYIKDGEVYYRTLAYQTLVGEKVWEIEQKITTLGTGNSTLVVIRTNDFRIGFMTEQSGQIKMALTKRTYPGASVKPEYVHIASTYATFSHLPVKRRYSYETESVSLQSRKAFIMLDTDDHRLTVTGTERIYSEDSEGNEYCSGAAVYLDKALIGSLPAAFISACTVSSSKLTVSGVSYDALQQALIYSFAWKSGYTPDQHPVSFNVTFPTCYDLTYEPLPGEYWYVEAKTATLEQITINHYAYGKENVTVGPTTATFVYSPVQYIYTFAPDETVSLGVASVEFSYLPVGDIPV